MSYANGTPNYDLPQTITTDKRDWADTNIPFLKLDSDLHYTKELAESFDERITQCEDDIDAHGVRLTELEKYVEDDPDGYAKYEYEEGNLFLIDGRVCVATTTIHEGHTLVEGVNYEVYVGGLHYYRYGGSYQNMSWTQVITELADIYHRYVYPKVNGKPFVLLVSVELYSGGSTDVFDSFDVTYLGKGGYNSFPSNIYGFTTTTVNGSKEDCFIHCRTNHGHVISMDTFTEITGSSPYGFHLKVECIY